MERYSRQVLLKEIGARQQLLMEKKVAIVGLGALGTHAADLLVRAGVENIILIDDDVIEESNLQRQTLFTEEDIGKGKVEVALMKLKEINPNVNVRIKNIMLTKENVHSLNTPDLVLDCTDNLKTRFIINEYCKDNKILWIYSAAVKTKGYVMPIFPEGPCLRCFLKEADLDNACTVGVLNTIVAVISAMAVTLAIKILVGEEIEKKLIYFDVWKSEMKKIEVKKNKNCRLCKHL